MSRKKVPAALAAAFAALAALSGAVQAAEVNVYSSRHYDSDDALYARFTEETGIQVNRIESKADELIARLQAEADNSPADVFITVDVGRMARAERAGLLQPFASKLIEARIPAHLRHPDGLWFGISQRARIIFHAKDRVSSPPRSYEELADPKWRGKVCIRSSSNIYNQSLLASLIEANGEEAARNWAAGIVANMVRPPQGGDTDQLRGIVSGECDVAVANHYYFVRGLIRDVEGLSDGIDGIGWTWPNQDGRGAHVNLSAAAMTRAAPNPDSARRLLEFLTGDFAQKTLARQNSEWPAVTGAADGGPAEALGTFRADQTTPTAAFGRNAARAQAIFNAVGWD